MVEREMTPDDVLAFVRTHTLAVIATVSAAGEPEAALMGIAMAPDNRIVFDTLRRSRKYSNLRHRKTIALVVGWNDETTVQLEGIIEEPAGADLEVCKAAYFEVFPDGREREALPDIAYVAVRITWMRYADYRSGGVGIFEHSC